MVCLLLPNDPIFIKNNPFLPNFDIVTFFLSQQTPKPNWPSLFFSDKKRIRGNQNLHVLKSVTFLIMTFFFLMLFFTLNSTTILVRSVSHGPFNFLVSFSLSNAIILHVPEGTIFFFTRLFNEIVQIKYFFFP